MNQSESVPSVLEQEATGETAAIYADIRATLRTSVVNLVWRNLATLPGALPWAWSMARPLYLGGAAGHAQAVRDNLAPPTLPNFSADVLSAAGLHASDLIQIRAILDSYYHTNALALVILFALIEHHEPSDTEPRQASQAAAPPVPSELPPLPAMAALEPAVQRLIAELNGFGEDEAPFLIASMYRHLAYWPPYLALIRTALAPLHANRTLVGLTQRARAIGRAHGRVLSRQLTISPPPPSLQDALASCRLFVEHPIARMAGICAALRASMPKAD